MTVIHLLIIFIRYMSGQLRQDSSNKTSQVTTKQKSKVEANERVSSAEDNSRDSFSSASFSSDSGILKIFNK